MRSGLRSPAVSVPVALVMLVLGVEPVTDEAEPEPLRLAAAVLDVVPLTLGVLVVEPLWSDEEPPGAVGEPRLEAEFEVVRGEPAVEPAPDDAPALGAELDDPLGEVALEPEPLDEPMPDGELDDMPGAVVLVPETVDEPAPDVELDAVRGAVADELGDALVDDELLDVRVEEDCPSVTNSNALKGIATSFWPMPRKPPTPTTSATMLPSRDKRMSLMSPTFSLLAP